MDEATTDQVADLHQKVRASIDEEDLDGAAALILEAREQGVLRDLDGASFGGWVRILGEIAWREGRPKRAARLVTGALGIQGDGASLQELGHSWLLLAHIQYEGRGRRRRARQSAQRAVRLLDAARDPAVIEANQLLGDILLDTGHERKAARSFGLALDGMEAFEVVDRTQRYELLDGLAEALEAIGDIEAACTARTRQVTSCDGPLERADTLTNLGLLEAALGRPAMASQHVREAIVILDEYQPVAHPDSPLVDEAERGWLNMTRAVAMEAYAHLLLDDDQPAEAVRVYREYWEQACQGLTADQRAYRLAVLSEMEVVAGDHGAAQRHLLQFLDVERETEAGSDRSYRLERAAAVALEMGDIGLAVRLLGLPPVDADPAVSEALECQPPDAPTPQ